MTIGKTPPPGEPQPESAKDFMKTGWRGGLQRLKNAVFGSGKLEKAAQEPESTPKVSGLSNRVFSLFKGKSDTTPVMQHAVTKGAVTNKESLANDIKTGNPEAMKVLCGMLSEATFVNKVLTRNVEGNMNLLELAAAYGRAEVVSAILTNAAPEDVARILRQNPESGFTALHHMAANPTTKDEDKVAILTAFLHFADENPVERGKIFSSESEGNKLFTSLLFPPGANPETLKLSQDILARPLYSPNTSSSS